VKDGVIPEDVLQETRAMAKQIDLDFLVSEIPQAIDGSLKGIERVTKIVSAMKEFSHPGRREKAITDINHAIENTIIVSRNEWKYAAEMVTDLDPELPHIPCLVDEFNQVILNLINNAADAIREAQSTRQDNEMGNISISTKRADSWVIVMVSDNGTGIPANIRERVFDPFFTTKEVGKGTGQGLLISYDVIVNKLGGKISFETEAGKGTTFIIHLPIEPIQENESTDL
jgi:signal transduction histidine kinase